MRVNGRRMRSRVTACISGVTADVTLGIGKATSWKISASTLGKTVADTKASTAMIRSMATGCTLGAIRRSTQAGGITVSSMASGFSYNGKADRRNMVFGRMAKRSVGLHPKKFKLSNLGRLRTSAKSSWKTLS